MENSIEKVVSDIRNHIQFLVTVEIFFSSIVFGFYKAIGSNDIISQNQSLVWGIGVGFCILNYLIVGLEKGFNKNLLIWVRRSIFVNLACFIITIIIFILVQYKPLPSYVSWPFIISLQGSLWIPTLTFLLIISAFYWIEIKWIWTFLQKLRKKRSS